MAAKKSVKKDIKKINLKQASYSPKKNIFTNKWVVIAVVLLIIVALILIIGPFITGRAIIGTMYTASAETMAIYTSIKQNFNLGAFDPDGDKILPGKNPSKGGVKGDDNCPTVYNPDQYDFDNDGIGNRCDPIKGSNEPDPDNDGLPSTNKNGITGSIVDPAPNVYTSSSASLTPGGYFTSTQLATIAAAWTSTVPSATATAQPTATGTQPSPSATATAQPTYSPSNPLPKATP